MEKRPGLNLLTVWIVTFKTEQADSRVGAVYLTLDAAKRECERLERTSSYVNVQAMPVKREVEVSDIL